MAASIPYASSCDGPPSADRQGAAIASSIGRQVGCCLEPPLAQGQSMIGTPGFESGGGHLENRVDYGLAVALIVRA